MNEQVIHGGSAYIVKLENTNLYFCSACRNILIKGMAQNYCDQCGAPLKIAVTNEVKKQPRYRLRSDNAFTYIEEESDEKP